MSLLSKKSFLFIAGTGGLAGLSYYFLSNKEAPIANNEEIPRKKNIIPRDRSNLKNVKWDEKAKLLSNKLPSSDALQPAKEWAQTPIVAANWLKFGCEDSTEPISDEDWNTYCVA